MRSLRRYVGRRMVIQLGEHTLDGTLSDARRDVVILTGATLINTSSQSQLDGDVAVPTGAVAWVQVV